MAKQDWFSLAAQMWLGALEAQQVVALRTAKVMRGGADAGPEMAKMVSEKIDAAMKAQQSGMELMLAGNGGQIARKTVSAYRRAIRANRRRLLKEL
jgi:ABC-type sugar transport system substrate-binding protein